MAASDPTMRRPRWRAVLPTASVGLLLIGYGCHLATIGDKELVSTSAAGGMGGFLATGGAGGKPECTVPAECPGDTDCSSPICQNGLCGLYYPGFETSCDDDGGVVCNGSGACVQCVEDQHCDVLQYCDANVCIKKALAEACSVPGQCESNFCTDGLCCDMACDGECVACVAAITSVADGTCAPVVANTDPQDECVDPQLCNGCGECEGGAPLGGSLFGDDSRDTMIDVRLDSQDNILLSGYFEGNIDFQNGLPFTSVGQYGDAFVVKRDVAGGHLWARRYGSGNDQRTYGIGADSMGNVFATGAILDQPVDFGGGAHDPKSWDPFVLKLDAAGNYQWSVVPISASTQIAADLCVDASDNVIVLGLYLGTLDFGGGALPSSGGLGTFVVKYNNAGQHQWSRGFSGISHAPRAITTDAAGDVLIGGLFTGTVNFGGGSIAASGTDGYLVKLSGVDGSYLNSIIIGGGGDQGLRQFAIDGSGALLVIGEFEGNIQIAGGPQLTSMGLADTFLVRLDANLAHQWSKSFGGIDDDLGRALVVDSADNIVIGGGFKDTVNFGGCQLTSAGDSDAFVAKFDTMGNHLFDWQAGDGGAQEVQSIAVQSDGHIVVTGHAQGSIDMGTGAVNTGVERDIFLMRLTP